MPFREYNSDNIEYETRNIKCLKLKIIEKLFLVIDKEVFNAKLLISTIKD